MSNKNYSQEGDYHRISKLGKWLDSQDKVILTIYATIAAFLAYMSMYAFRKPWSAISYDGVDVVLIFGVAFNYKTIAAISQLLGYMLSKFLGIKFASEATLARRVPIVIGLILFAELMLFGFATVPNPYNLVFLLLNGLPLGMVWSMIFGIVEGRRYTEFLALGMSVSVIFASAWVKDVGRWTIDLGADIFWMPFFTGLIFIPVLALSMFMLWHVPPPSKEDKENRTERKSMNRQDRKNFIRKYFFGIAAMVIGYMFLMAYRNVRDDFMIDILRDLGYAAENINFGSMENWVGLTTIVVLCCLWFFKSNIYAVWANIFFILLGTILIGASTLMVTNKMIDPKFFMIINGIGLYIAFVPYQSIFMDRILAALKTTATASFLVSLGDSYGYLTVLVNYVLKDIIPLFQDGTTTLEWAEFLKVGSYVILIGVPICMAIMMFSFRKKMHH